MRELVDNLKTSWLELVCISPRPTRAPPMTRDDGHRNSSSVDPRRRAPWLRRVGAMLQTDMETRADENATNPWRISRHLRNLVRYAGQAGPFRRPPSHPLRHSTHAR